MKKLIPILALIAVSFLRPAPCAGGRRHRLRLSGSVQERLDDLEAYVNNGCAQMPAPMPSSKIAGTAGPGHNAWR